MSSSNPQSPDSQKAAWQLPVLDNPALRPHVENHLLFGPLSRQTRAAWIYLFLAIMIVLWVFFENLRLATLATHTLDAGIALAGTVTAFAAIRRRTPFAQAAFGWLTTKIVIGITAFFVALAALLSMLSHSDPAAPLLFIAALLWIPGPEFLPSVPQHQRWITLARLSLTALIVLAGFKAHRW